jgi:hypothetical protein
VTAAQVEDISNAMGMSDWQKLTYNKFHHNCVDFARQLSAKLGAGDLPLWCYRGQALGKALGLAGPEPEDSMENGLESGAQSPAVPMGPASGSLAAPIGDVQLPGRAPPPRDSMTAAIELAATKSLSGTYVAPPPLPAGPPPGSLAGTYVAPPIVGRGPSYVAPPPPAPHVAQLVQAPAAPAEGLSAGSRVSVHQNTGEWASGKVICRHAPGIQDLQDRYTILYDINWSTEVNVAQSRIVPLPPQQASNDSVAQAFYADARDIATFQGLASADSVFEPLKQQGKSLGVPGGIRGGRFPTFPSFAAPAALAAPAATQPSIPTGSFTMGGFPPPRAPVTAMPSAHQPFLLSGISPYPTAPMFAPRGRDTLGATWRF